MTSAYLDRFVDEQRLVAGSDSRAKAKSRYPICGYMSQTGRRVAEMHTALASNRDIADFAPEPNRPEDAQRWIDDIMARAERVFDILTQRREA